MRLFGGFSLILFSIFLVLAGCKETSEAPTQAELLKLIKLNRLDVQDVSTRDYASSSRVSIPTGNSFVCENITDPFANLAWHLNHLNSPAREVVSQNKIRVGVSDSGLDIAHPDLSDNVLLDESVHFLTGNDPTPSPDYAQKYGDHGTSVAGIIGASSCNGKGSRGIAPFSQLAGLNLLAPEVKNNKNFNLFLLLEATYDFDIVNQSWAYGETLKYWPSEFQDYMALVKESVENGRILIKGAGNYYPRDLAYDPDHRHPYVILVGAINKNGFVSRYSSPGANLWVGAPSGDFALDGIVTTEATAKNPSSPYRTTFSGTSAATPMVSGVVALMLQKNPSLNWRQIKHILATTATKVDSQDKTWIENKASPRPYSFSRDYGFGHVNAGLAVEWAVCSVLPTPQNCNGKTFDLGAFRTELLGQKSQVASIPDIEPAGISQTFSVPQSLTIESMELTLDISHPFPSDLEITLTSPSGTQAIVLEPHPEFYTEYPNMRNIRLIINGFYGEKTNGSWTLKVRDLWKQDSVTLNSWKLKVYGH